MINLTFRTEAKRLAHSRKPSILQWYIDWPIDELRSEVTAWLMYDMKVPAILCTRLESIRDYAPAEALDVVLHPLQAMLNPIEGYGWFESLAALERWALDTNEVDR